MKKKILVTGSHRSGSTWTGKVISKAQNVRYIHEPFNIANSQNNSPFNYWFECLIDSSSEHQKKARKYLDAFYKVIHISNLNNIFKSRSLKELLKHLADLKSRITDRTLIKDPIAIMSAEWLYMNYNIYIIVLIRHPAAFVASLKVKDWQFNFNNYLNQSVLMHSYLKAYENEIEDFSKNKKDIIDQGILLWNTIYDTVAYYEGKYGSDWCFVKHEDLSINPMLEFNKIFSKIDLKLNSDVKKYIKETTSHEQEAGLKRNSIKNTKTWKKRLTEDEIERIKQGTEKVWKKFYTLDDW